MMSSLPMSFQQDLDNCPKATSTKMETKLETMKNTKLLQMKNGFKHPLKRTKQSNPMLETQIMETLLTHHKTFQLNK